MFDLIIGACMLVFVMVIASLPLLWALFYDPPSPARLRSRDCEDHERRARKVHGGDD